MAKQEIDVKIISKESIKPSSPTPLHLKTFHLSFLDKLFPTNLYPHLTAFYPFLDDHNYHRRVRDLKSSLSETLTRYYPLAGRINKNESFIDCTDVGADFIEAKVSCNLADILNEPDLACLLRLLPAEIASLQGAAASDAVLIVQTSLFQCGGLAVCVSLSHNVADACTLGIFVKEWAARTRGAGDIVLPDVITAVASRFPAAINSTKPYLIYEEKSCQTRRYVFDSKSINGLKSKAKSASLQRPSRVEVVAGHIWQSRMKSSLRNNTSIKPHVLLQPMNLRKRIHPPLSENSLGSFTGLSFAVAPDQSDDDNVTDHQLDSLVGKIRRGYQRVIEWYGRKKADIFDTTERFKGYPIGAVELVVTSGCRYTFYEDSDFGWGKPVWVIVGNNGDTKRKIVTLMDTKDGDGIEAWITLEDHVMNFLDTDKDFLEFANVNPSINIHSQT